MDENWLNKFSSNWKEKRGKRRSRGKKESGTRRTARREEEKRNMFDISVGAHSCAMHSRLKAAPTITISEREMLRFGWVRT